LLQVSNRCHTGVAETNTCQGLAGTHRVDTADDRETGRPAYSPGHGVNFKHSDHVFVKSALTVDFTYRDASAALPLFRGLSPLGKNVFYIITDASDFEVARRMGVNYAPSLPPQRVRLACSMSRSKTAL
jgi:hypothetical protein